MAASMRIVSAVEVSAGAAERWRSQYRDWSRDDKFADGSTKGEHDDALNAHQHTPENISTILNDGWAYPQCSFCGEYRHVVVEMRAEWGDDSDRICLHCLDKASSILNPIPLARSALSGAQG